MCNKYIPNYLNLRNKFQRERVCSKKSKKQNYLKKSKTYYCSFCNCHFGTPHKCAKSALSPRKGVAVSLEKPFEICCEFCNAHLPQSNIDLHLKTCGYAKKKLNDSKPIEVKLYQCMSCHLKFDTRRDYRRHRYHAHGAKCRVICFRCGISVVNLNQHLKSVHGNPNAVKCSQCDKTFSCLKHLNRHKLVHSSEQKHQCQTCGKGFKTPFSLRVHLRSHEAVKPFECTVCLKTFTTKQWRDNHRKTHKIV